MQRSTLQSLLAGAAATGSLTLVVVMTGLVLGVVERPPWMVLAAGLGAVAVAAWTGQGDLNAVAFRGGAVAAGILALAPDVLESTPGIGVLQIIAVAAGLLLAVAGPVNLAPLQRPVPPWLVAVGFAALAFVLVRIVLGGGELGHDEAAYALKARAWLEGTPETGWDLHRGVGQSVLATVVLPFSHSPVALRAVAVVLSLATVAAVWGLGRAMGSRRAGLLAAGVFAVAPSFIRRGAEFLTDVPSTGLLVVVAMLLWRWTRAENGHRLLYGAAVAAALAVYIRYQSFLTLGLLAVATAVVGWDRVRGHLGAVGKAAGLGLLLLVPHFVHAVAATGVPWGIVADTAGAGGREYLGEGLVDYARDFPDLLAGQLGAVAIVAGAAWGVWRLLAGRGRAPALFLGIPAVGQFVLLGAVSHGEPRFVFFPVALFAVAAALAADDLRGAVPGSLYRAGAWVAAAAVLVSLGLHGDRFDRNAEARSESIGALVESAEFIRADAQGECGIVTGLQPQMTWFSGCATERYHRDSPLLRFDSGVVGYLVLAEEAPRQPTGEWRTRYLDLAEQQTVIESDGSYGDVEVWRVE